MTNLLEPARVRLPAKDIVHAVVRNMRENLEDLPYSRLAPSRYTVYLHPNEFARLETIVPIMQEQTVRALSEELVRLGRHSHLKRWTDRVRRRSVPGVEKAGTEFHVDCLPDPDEELEEGGVLVYSELRLPPRPELSSGERTRRITTVHTSHGTTVREQTVKATGTEKRIAARIEYLDDMGQHAYEVATDSVMIGRGGIAYPVDVKIVSSPDVSREHARIRRDPKSGTFYLIDLSSFGSTLNGRHVPRGYDEVDGKKRENGSETALPDVARIGLADIVFLEFRKVL